MGYNHQLSCVPCLISFVINGVLQYGSRSERRERHWDISDKRIWDSQRSRPPACAVYLCPRSSLCTSQMYFCNTIIAERCPSTACQAARKSSPSFQRWYWDVHHIIYCMLQGFCMLTRYFFIPYPFSEQKTEMQKKVSSFMSLSRISLLCISTNENRTLQVKESLVQFHTDFIYSNSFLLWIASVILTVHVCRPFTLPCTNSSSSSMSLLKFESISHEYIQRKDS